VELDEGDYLVGVAITDGNYDVMLFSDAGKAVRFSEQDVRAMGRTARGVRGMTLGAGQQVISLLVARTKVRPCSPQRRTVSASAHRSANTLGTAAARKA
jgi:DNA gyrase/topoisomerase IV subunit A